MSVRPLFVVAVLAPLSVFATVVLSMSVEEMAQRAPLVVRGTVHRVDTQWDEAGGKIWTWSEVVVRETLKGQPRTTALVKQPGGTVGAVSQHVSGVATFAPGEEVVLFLEPAVDDADSFVPMAMAASKVTLGQRFGQAVAWRDLSGLTFARLGAKGVVKPVEELEVLGRADAFLERVRVAVRGGR